MKGSLWIVAIVGIGLVVGIVAIPAQLSAVATIEHANNEGPTEIQSNESYHLDPGGAVEIIEIYDNETVVNNDTDFEYTEGTHYYLNGTQLRAINNTAADGETVNVSYSYRTADDRTNQIASLYSVISPIIPVAFVGAVLATLMAFGGRF